MSLDQLKKNSTANGFIASFFSASAAAAAVLDQSLWFILLMWILACYFLLTALQISKFQHAYDAPHTAVIPDIIKEIMDVKEAREQDGRFFYSGKLKEKADTTYKILAHAFAKRAIPMLQDTWQGELIILVPGQLEKLLPHTKTRPLTHFVLAILTVITTTFAGAIHSGYQSIFGMSELLAGLSYSIPLLAILGIHELGHFTVARLHGMRVTPPFFIPVPFGLGTLGAFIQVKSPPVNRTSLFDMAIAGPLAGFIVAVPVLIFGLKTSTILHPAHPQVLMTGSFWDKTPVSGSLLLTLLANIARGGAVHYGDLLILSPLALAGWIGMWVTAFNLLPIGQLDGGHVSQGMFGSKWCVILTKVAMVLLGLGAIFIWPGFLVWLFVLYFIAGSVVPPLNDLTHITKWRFALGCFALSLILLIFLPVPYLGNN